MMDISKCSKQALQKYLFDEAMIPMCLSTPTQLLRVNQAFLNLTGYDRDEMEGKCYGDFFPSIDLIYDWTKQEAHKAFREIMRLPTTEEISLSDINKIEAIVEQYLQELQVTGVTKIYSREEELKKKIAEFALQCVWDGEYTIDGYQSYYKKKLGGLVVISFYTKHIGPLGDDGVNLSYAFNYTHVILENIYRLIKTEYSAKKSKAVLLLESKKPKAGVNFGNVNVTLRETEVLYYLVRGMSVKEIAREINISHRTVEGYIKTLRDKLGCYNRSSLIQKVLDSYVNYL